MSEAIGEMILPGTYIEVRSEGLIGVGGISTGNIGVVGTANRGPLNTPVILGSYTEAVDTFGSYDSFPGTATKTTSAFVGWVTIRAICPLSGSPMLRHVFPPSVDL